MERAYYLYGAKGTIYTELARSNNLESFLRNDGAINTNSVVNEVLKIGGDFKIDDSLRTDYYVQPENLYNIRYYAVHLYKKDNSFKNLVPFSVLCVNGLQNTINTNSSDSREIYYHHLSFIHKEDFCTGADGFSYLEQIFGSRLFLIGDLQEYESGNLKFNEAYHQIMHNNDFDLSEDAFSSDLRLVEAVCATLYASPSYKVIIRLRPTENVMRRGLSILKKIYSMLPPLMAFETGFSLFEQPTRIEYVANNSNIRIFILSGNSIVSGRELQKNCLCLDLKNLLPKDKIVASINNMLGGVDKNIYALYDALDFWAKMPWSQRSQTMGVLFRSASRYFDSEYFIIQTDTLKNSSIWEFLKKSDRLSNASNMNSFLTDLYKEYYYFKKEYKSILNIPWLFERYKEHLLSLLPEMEWGTEELKAFPDYSKVTLLKLELAKICLKYSKNPKNENMIKKVREIQEWICVIWTNPYEDQVIRYEIMKIETEKTYRETLEKMTPGSSENLDIFHEEREMLKKELEKEKADFVANGKREIQIIKENLKKKSEELKHQLKLDEDKLKKVEDSKHKEILRLELELKDQQEKYEHIIEDQRVHYEDQIRVLESKKAPWKK